MSLSLISVIVLASATTASARFAAAPVSTQEPDAAAPPESAGAPTQEGLVPVQVKPAEDEQRDDEQRLVSLYEGTLLGMQDGQDFAETPAYRRLVEIIGGYGEDELRDKAPPLFDRAALIADPGAWRGELLHVRGLLAGLTAERLSHPIGEHVDVYRAVVMDPIGDDAIVIDFLNRPPFEPDLGDDMVETEAVFARLVGYVSNTDIPREAPYLIARSIRKWDTTQHTRRTAFDTFAILLIGAALAFFVVRIVYSMRSRKGRSDDPEKAARLIRERARAALQSRPPSRPPASKP